MKRNGGHNALTRAIDAHLAEWDTAHVELAIYGYDDASLIAQAIDEFCRERLRAGVAGALFYRSSIGATAGVELLDGRRAVVKAHQPDWSRQRLEEVVRLQTLLWSRGLFAPKVLAGPSPLGRGLAVAEEYVDRGVPCDAHEPEFRRALAVSLHTVIEVLQPLVGDSSLPGILFPPPNGELWPSPHSRLFDFHATRCGAEYIDALAKEACERLTPRGRIVLGHADWRAEHVRFEGTQAILAFDWDSLTKAPEPVLVGQTAHAFCADWSRPQRAQAPTIGEARSFVREYETARGRPFTAEERRLCGTAFAYSVAYTARCGHALDPGDRERPGSFQYLVATEGARLLNL